MSNDQDETCQTCRGDGRLWDDENEEFVCPTCNASGRAPLVQYKTNQFGPWNLIGTRNGNLVLILTIEAVAQLRGNGEQEATEYINSLPDYELKS